MPKAQTGMAGGKYRPNTYDGNLVKRHDDNSAINSKPQSPQAIGRARSCGTIRRILRPKRHQTTMKAWKYRPNTYDVNLVKRHDDNSAINMSQLAGLNKMDLSAFHGPNMAAETTVHRLSQ